MIDMKKAQDAMLAILREASIKKADKIRSKAPAPKEKPSKYRGFNR